MTYAFCPEWGLACSTAALTHGCRCDVCGPWYATFLAERREGRPAKVVHVPSPTCPANGCKASTAFLKLKCRCDVCRGWNASRKRRQYHLAKAEAAWVRWESELRSDPESVLVFARWVSANMK